MKKIEIKTHIDDGRMIGLVEKDQKVIFTTDDFFSKDILGLQLKSETRYDTGKNLIILKKIDLINILNFLLEKGA